MKDFILGVLVILIFCGWGALVLLGVLPMYTAIIIIILVMIASWIRDRLD